MYDSTVRILQDAYGDDFFSDKHHEGTARRINKDIKEKFKAFYETESFGNKILQDRLTTITAERDALKSQYDSAVKGRQDLRQAYREARTERDALKADIEAERELFSDTIKGVKADRDRYRDALEEIISIDNGIKDMEDLTDAIDIARNAIKEDEG